MFKNASYTVKEDPAKMTEATNEARSNKWGAVGGATLGIGGGLVAGAKMGAMAGMLGGPIGAAIGTAVGGLVGGGLAMFAGSKLGEGAAWLAKDDPKQVKPEPVKSEPIKAEPVQKGEVRNGNVASIPEDDPKKVKAEPVQKGAVRNGNVASMPASGVVAVPQPRGQASAPLANPTEAPAKLPVAPVAAGMTVTGSKINNQSKTAAETPESKKEIVAPDHSYSDTKLTEIAGYMAESVSLLRIISTKDTLLQMDKAAFALKSPTVNDALSQRKFMQM
jgi:hypothetical protein